MWTVSWFRDLIEEKALKNIKSTEISIENYLNQEAEKISAGSEGLMTILDWLSPTDKQFKKGMWIGFDGRHNYRHMYKSILEGIALTMKNNADKMCADLNITPDNLLITGGGSNSDIFMNIFSDVFNLPVKRNIVNGSASLVQPFV